MESYRIHKVPDPTQHQTPAQATTIPLQPKGLRGKKKKTVGGGEAISKLLLFLNTKNGVEHGPTILQTFDF